jgi:hypothetical protein
MPMENLGAKNDLLGIVCGHGETVIHEDVLEMLQESPLMAALVCIQLHDKTFYFLVCIQDEEIDIFGQV